MSDTSIINRWSSAGLVAVITAGIGFTIPIATGTTAEAAPGPAKTAVAASPSLTEATESAEDAKAELDEAKSDIRKIRKAVIRAEAKQATAKKALGAARKRLDDISGEARDARRVSEAAVKVRELVETGGFMAVDPVEAVSSGIDVIKVIDVTQDPTEQVDEVEKQASTALAKVKHAEAGLTKAKKREHTAENAVQRATKGHTKVARNLKHAVEIRKEKWQANRVATTELEAAEERADAAELRAAEAAKSARSSSSSSVLAPGNMSYPGTSHEVTSPYGMRTHPITGVYKLHSGTDFSAGDGYNHAAFSGTVEEVTYDGAYGNMVTISHGTYDGATVQTRYAHNDSVSVSPGQEVSTGEVLGTVGATGYATGPHIHFEVLLNGEFDDPMKWLGS